MFTAGFFTPAGEVRADRDGLLPGRRVVPLSSAAELRGVLTRLGGPEMPWVEFDPDDDGVRVYPACDVLDRIP